MEDFTHTPIKQWSEHGELVISRNGFNLRVVKDLSEIGEEISSDILTDLTRQFDDFRKDEIFLIAANEGRLRAILSRSPHLRAVYEEVDEQLKYGAKLDSQDLIVLNLNKVSTSSFVLKALDWITEENRWQVCSECSAQSACPIFFNVNRLASKSVASQLQFLYQILEQLNLHVTIRDMLIHLAFTVTGGLDCQKVIAQSNTAEGRDNRHRYVYYQNVWGETTDEVFRRKILVTRHLRRLNVGETSIFEIDNFIINGYFNGTEHSEDHVFLFQHDSLDLGGKLFSQQRKAYLQSGSSSPDPDVEHALMAWLPQCRRKLFFEWKKREAVNHLLPFQYLPEYFKLLAEDRTVFETCRNELILGLNRAFSGLYLSDANHLYVTSQYAHAVEQPVPIVRIKIAASYIEMKVKERQTLVFDGTMPSLWLVFPPPPRVDADAVEWKLDLFSFEYLMRRARGGTPDVLSRECELEIRRLKDEILSRFGNTISDQNQITFFAVEKNRYTLKDIWVEDGQIRTS